MTKQVNQKKKKNLAEILQDYDHMCTKEKTDKFNKITSEALKCLDIQTDKTDFVDTLMKIESKLSYYCEARNFL